MKPVGPNDQNDPILRSKEPRSSYGANWPSRSKRPIFMIKRSPKQMPVKIFNMEPVGPNGQNGLVSWSNNLQTSYGANWPSWQKCPILKVKRTPEQLALTTKKAYFQDQTSPGASKPPIFSIFVLYSP
ncbi:hypothetical protein H5410_054493 [Solanum commersonii]|uniref:Uncharacterized protein n=1 Tax=Solanum commersonii TaxID=4109 RepID=A0A9J5WG74_SOLCO|nr:hypothetical protein H5410_054493 [Solanum commersonii]